MRCFFCLFDIFWLRSISVQFVWCCNRAPALAPVHFFSFGVQISKRIPNFLSYTKRSTWKYDYHNNESPNQHTRCCRFFSSNREAHNSTPNEKPTAITNRTKSDPKIQNANPTHTRIKYSVSLLKCYQMNRSRHLRTNDLFAAEHFLFLGTWSQTFSISDCSVS